MKKHTFFAALLAVCLLLTLITGCNNGDSTATTTAATTAAATTATVTTAATTTPATSGRTTADDLGGLMLPIVDKPLTLTYWVDAGSSLLSITSYNDMKLFQVKAEETGISIDFKHPPAGQGTEQLNLMLASQDYTDLIWASWSGMSGGPAKQIDDGAIITLNDYLDDYAPNYSKLLADEPSLAKQVMTDDGMQYCFPWVNLYDETRVYMGFVVRQDWLDKLGLEQPVTLADWESMLIAFRDNDPNGNGESDEIPYATNGKLTGLYRFLYSWDICPEWYIDTAGTTVAYGAVQPEFLEWLQLIRRWYDEGLVDPDYASTDSTLFDAMVTNDQCGSLFGYVGGGIGKYMTLMETAEPDFMLCGTEYPVLIAGDKPSRGHRIYEFNGSAVAISTACEHIPEAVQYIDYDYSERGHLLNCFGIEGESYTMVDGEPIYTDLIVKNPDGKAFSDIMYVYNRFAGVFSGVHSASAQMQYMALDTQREAITKWSNTTNSIFMPPLTPSTEDASTLATIMNEISTYQSETVNKFIMGQLELSEYDAFVAQLGKMKLEDAVKIQQKALDAYNTR